MRIVGKVAVKVWPDTRNFKKEADAKIGAMRLEAPVELKPELDDRRAEVQLRKGLLRLQKIANDNPIQVKLRVEYDNAVTSLRAKLASLKRVARLNPVEIRTVMGDEVEMPRDGVSILNVIPRIANDEVDKARQSLRDSLGHMPVDLGWSPSTITELKRKLRDEFKDWAVESGFDVAQRDLFEVRTKVRESLQKIRVRLDEMYDESSLGKLQKKLKDNFDLHIKPELDGTATKLVKEQLRRVFAETKAHIKAALSPASVAKVKAQLATAFRTTTVKVRAVLDNKSVKEIGTALAALSGGRLVKEIYRIDLLKNFDKMLPMLSLIGTAVGILSAAIVALVGDVLVLGRHLAQIIPIGLALPGVLAGFIVGAIGAVRALKDLNEQVPQIKKGFEQIGKSISQKFWAQARGPVSQLADKWLPKIRKGMDLVATAQGKWLGKFASELNSQVTPALGYWFRTLASSTDIMRGMAGPLASIIRDFGDIGAVYLPEFSKWLTQITTDFSRFLDGAVRSGAAFEWIDLAIVRVQEFWRVITGAFGVLSVLSAAAEEAGSATLKGMGDGLHAMAESLRANFDTVVTVFKAANDAMDNMVKSAGPGMRELFNSMGQSIGAVLPLIGSVAGLLVGSLGTILAQPMVGKGMLDFFTGLHDALLILQPALKDIGDGFGALLTLGGTMLESFAPTLALAFEGAGNAATGLLWALNEVVPVLSKGLFDALSAVMPAFRELTPIIAETIVLLGTTLGESISGIAPQIETLANGVGTLAGAFLEAFGPVVASFIEQLAPIIGRVAETLGEMAEAAAPVVTKIGELVGQFVDWLMPIFQDVADNVLPKLSDAWGRLMESLGPVLDGVKQLGDFLGPILGPVIEFIMNLIGESFVGVLNGLADTFEGVTKIITGIVDAFKAAQEGDWSALEDALKKIWDGLWQAIIGLVQIALNIGVLGIVKKGWALLKGLFTDGGPAIKKIWDDVWNKIKAFADDIWRGIKTAVGKGIDDVKGAVKDGLGKLKGFADDAWGKFKDACGSGIDKAVSLVKELPGKITGALGNLGNLLFNSGKSILDGLARGISAGVGAATSAARSAMDAVRRLFPSSPAKEGPFSGKGWTLYSGRAIAESIGDGLDDRLSYARQKANALASAVRSPLEGQAIANSNRIARATSGSVAGVGGGDTYEFNLTVNLDDIDQVQDLIEFAETLRRRARAQGGKL